MHSFTCQLFFILIYIKSIYTYPDGAPNDMCGTMMPSHSVSAQSCSANYIIQSNKTQYSANETVQITVSGATSSDTFRGFLLTAKTKSGGQIIGSWTVVSSDIKALDCDRVAKTGVTHSSRTDKTLVVAIWTAPSTISAEDTIIRATVVKTGAVIFVDCFNVTLTNRDANQTTNITVTTTTTTAAPQTSDVGINISWTYTNGITAVKMKINNLKTAQWLALGLSLDSSMGDDHVFICKRLADDTVKVDRYTNEGGYTAPQLVSTDKGGTFNATLGRFADGVATCEFTLSNFASSGRRRRSPSALSQTTAYYPLIAIGNLGSSNALIKHTSRSALSQSVQLNREETIVYNIDPSDSGRVALVKAHGIIMIFTWILFVSTGVLIARHFKPSWPETKVCGKPIWFTIHRTVMISVVVLTIIAFILILVYADGKWISSSEQPKFAHSIVGIIVICFALVQPIMAVFRCEPDAKYRFIFNYVHRAVGLSAFILSIVAIFIAMFFTQFNFDVNKEWGILIAWTCWVLIIFFIFWFIEFYFRRIGLDEENPNSYDLDNTTPKNERAHRTNSTLQHRIKLAFLILHILVAFGIALALAILVGKA